ncbi:transport and Golgi organization protein 6 homolog [Polyodon spathula]|uniref:transport and Golgi organization protein 6 homolog n=1 Tax=Polyodon spathula TaxID=7913 RepID=UPI001B7DBEEB|nr:transport and Golgi organization protein 6 homolog [Polyodon spathula]
MYEVFCWVCYRQVIEFISAMLKRACVSLDLGVKGTVAAETLSMGMGLMATILAGAVKLQSDYAAMKELLPLLDQISQWHPEQVIQELASDLHLSIATHGEFAAETVARAARNTAGKEELIPERRSENTASKTTEKAESRNSDKTPGTGVMSQTYTAHCKTADPVSDPVPQSSSRGDPYADPAGPRRPAHKGHEGSSPTQKGSLSIFHGFLQVFNTAEFCLTAVIKTDSEAEVCRAAVHIIALLLRGRNDNATQMLSGVLRDLYRVLKHVLQHDLDDVTMIYAHLELEELDDVMWRYIFLAQKLEKKIVVIP